MMKLQDTIETNEIYRAECNPLLNEEEESKCERKCEEQEEQEEKDESKDFKKLHIIANSGSLMEFEDANVIIDISKVQITSHTERPPIIYDHDWGKPVGHFESVSVKDGSIVVDAIISCDNKYSNEIKASLANGFPWQASLGFKVKGGERYDSGEEFIVNGEEYTASKTTYVASAIEIWECSIVLFGADCETEVYKAKYKEQNQMEEVKPIETEMNIDVQAQAIEAANKIREAELAEVNRIKSLKDIANQYEASEQLADAITAGTDPREFELNVLRASFNKAPAVQVKTEEDKMNTKTFEALAVMEAGLTPKHYDEKTIEAADKMRGWDFRDVVEACTGYNPTYAERRDGSLWTAGVSTYNLNSILSNTANAILLQSFEESLQQWRQIFRVSVVNDFKQAERYRVGEDCEFKQATNGGELEHIVADDVKFTIQADVYGRQGEVTYKDIVNGNALGVFADVMSRFAYGANRAINKKCWSLFMNPSNFVDNKAFYHADHNNLVTGKALSADNLAYATAKFQTRKKGYGADANEILGVRAKHLIVPPSLEYKASLLTKASMYSPADNQVSDYNPLAAYGWNVVSVPQLEDSTFTNYSATTWYISCDPNQIAAFEIAFLNGQQAPTIRQQDVACGRLGICFDGHIDFGVGQQDVNGIMKITA